MSSIDPPTIPDSSPRQPPRERIPELDPRYELRSLIAKGGMGEVWAAHDRRVDREIAIKVMRSDSSDRVAAARFLREARVQCRLDHPAVVPVHDLGETGEPFFAMKRLTGTTLNDVLAAQRDGDAGALERWPRRLLLARFVDICLAIELAHQREVIHRDLKPANIMLGDYGEAYVLDWGLAKIAGVEDSVKERAPTQPGQTVAGTLLGTPGYMPPEQMRGEAIDRRADVFALGCILYEIVTGQPAIPRDDAYESTLSAKFHRPSHRSLAIEIDPELDGICARATAADRDDRISTPRLLADEVQAYLDGDRDRSHRKALAITHTDRARELLAKPDATSRAEAMREAGRALALDATNRDAQAALARMLLEPPTDVPPQARVHIEEDRSSATRVMMRSSMFGYIVFIIVIGVLKFALDAATWPMALLGGLLLVLVTMCWLIAKHDGWQQSATLYVSMVGLHLMTIAAAGFIIGPLLIIPMIVVGSLAAILVNPAARFLWLTGALHAIAILLPLGFELAGVVPRTFQITDVGIHIAPWAIHLSPNAWLGMFAISFALQILITTKLLTDHRKQSDRTLERLHVQQWHFAQLVDVPER